MRGFAAGAASKLENIREIISIRKGQRKIAGRQSGARGARAAHNACAQHEASFEARLYSLGARRTLAESAVAVPFPALP
jgi:hypothetical protein